MLAARPDDHASNYNLGRLYASRADLPRAIAAYETALRLRPDLVPALVNLSLAYHAIGRNTDAESALRRAIAIEPGSAAAQLNLGMLLGQLGRLPEAEAALRAAFHADPSSAAAAYNLAVVVSRDRLGEAVTWSRRASELDPASPKYAYTWAFYLAQHADKQAAIAVLRRALDRKATSPESYALLGSLLTDTGHNAEANALYRRAADEARLSAAERARFRGVPVPWAMRITSRPAGHPSKTGRMFLPSRVHAGSLAPVIRARVGRRSIALKIYFETVFPLIRSGQRMIPGTLWPTGTRPWPRRPRDCESCGGWSRAGPDRLREPSDESHRQAQS